MASRREGREDRLGQRLRGAQRAQVGSDDTFNLDVQAIAPDQPIRSSSSPHEAAQTAPPPQITTARASSPAGSEASRQETSREESEEQNRSPDAASEVPRSYNERSSALPTPRYEAEPIELDEPEPLRAPSSALPSAVQRPRQELEEEVTESPPKKPGSGHRRRIPVNQDIGRQTTGFRASSSPSTSRDQRSESPLARKNPRSEPTPGFQQPILQSARGDSEREQASRAKAPSQPQREALDETEVTEESGRSDEDAVGISAREASKVIGRKRPNASLTSQESDDSPVDEDTSSAAPRRSRSSPARQRQPTKRPKPMPKRSRQKQLSSSSEQNDDKAVEITIQRFVNNFPRDAEDEDELQQEIPFANRGGETVVDVFAQVCEEVINSTLDQLQRVAGASDDPDKKKECRIQMRAIGAYREELNSRLLQHAIHLNHWHSLRRRLRHVQKEKLALRDEIIRLKAEREQVALRMDAIRIKYEADSKESTSRLNASALMHDIDVAVEQGREAPELSRSAERKAELGNLDLVLAQISDHISPNSSTGGLLQQLKDLNAFLERVDAALEPK